MAAIFLRCSLPVFLAEAEENEKMTRHLGVGGVSVILCVDNTRSVLWDVDNRYDLTSFKI